MSADLKAERYRAAWAAVNDRDLKKEIERLPMAIRAMGLPQTLAILQRGRGESEPDRRGASEQVADLLAAWLLRDHPARLLHVSGVPETGRVPARVLLAALLESTDPIAAAALADEAIEYAAAMKLLAAR